MARNQQMSHLLLIARHRDRLLPDAAVTALAAAGYMNDLVRTPLSETSARALLARKLDARNAETLYYNAPTEVLADAVLSHNENRLGPLETILRRIKPGAAVQRKLTGRKLPNSLAEGLIQIGTTLDAAERLVSKSLEGISTEHLGLLLVSHGAELELNTLERILSRLLNDPESLPLATTVIAARPELRNRTIERLADGGANSLTVAVAAGWMPADEQIRFAEALAKYWSGTHNGSKHLVAAACLCDRPSTTKEVRRAVYALLVSTDQPMTLRWQVTSPELWPSCETLAELNSVEIARLLQRAPAIWHRKARMVQLGELVGTRAIADDEDLTTMVAFGVEIGFDLPTGSRSILPPWYEAATEPLAHPQLAVLSANNLRRHLRQLKQLTAMQAWSTEAESCATLIPAQEQHTQAVKPLTAPALSEVPHARAVSLDELHPYRGNLSEGTALTVLSYISDCFGNEETAWTLGNELLGTLTTNVGDVVDVVKATLGHR